MYEEPLLGKSIAYTTCAQVNKRRHLQDEQRDLGSDFKAVIHQLNSFFALVYPVSLSIIFSSLAALYISDPAMKQAMTTYMYYQDNASSELSTTVKTEQALFNAFLVIVFIAILTFGVVLLYKCNGMHLFAMYCILYSSMLLGLMGAKLTVIMCNKFHLVVDSISLTLVMYNFAVVGVLSIFYQKGIPNLVERGYLIITSVIVAWQLAQLPEWSIWMLLLLLGFWDLFAVLTPIGPLRCLVDLVHEKGTPIPGLLYESNVEDSHIGKTRQIHHVHSRKLATRDTMPEEEFIRRLLLPAPMENMLQERNAVTAIQFFHQVQTFLSDQNSQCQNRSEELSRKFEHNQFRLWRNFYSYYSVDYVARQRPYPSHKLVLEQSQVGNGSPIQRHETSEDKSIKLGLGDFIFYSVLVARASLHGFAVFAACFLAILVGLGVTLYLLARFDALPALPISLFLGIIVYLLSITIITPLLDKLQTNNIF